MPATRCRPGITTTNPSPPSSSSISNHAESSPAKPTLDDPPSALSPISPWPPPLSTFTQNSYSQPSSSSSIPDIEILPSAKEIYGFLAVVLTYLSFFVYLIWAFCPSSWLDHVGWTWYPDREWALVIPCYLMVVVLLTYLSYAGLTLYNTPHPDSISLFMDPKPIPCNVDTDSESDKEPFYWKYTDPTAIPVAHDFPHHLVERVVRARPKPVQGDILDNAFT